MHKYCVEKTQELLVLKLALRGILTLV